MTLKRILWTVVVIVLAIGIYYWYQQRSDEDTLKAGGVTSSDNSYSAASKARMDSGAVDLDGRPVNTTPSPAPVRQLQPTPTPAPVVTQNTPVATPVSATAPDNSMPAGDTLSPDAPAGMAFGGSGKFQWYRQGNLTWRINTQSGATCIAFATMEEWEKPIVYTHGCGNA
ncbi:hypothetical protein ACFQBQ_05505 [Granulicella cerasi]|uniref:Secreted protein n=1 Tax=Granulicella cerasi TaxID=741063 RepID=A0ABW1Z6I1_9BACT|nr:hypothetical protein [Granulicella cerasi]